MMSVKDALAMAQNQAFAEFMGEQLAERGWTVKQLAEEVGVNCTTAFRALVSGRARAAPKTLARLAPALGMSVGELNSLYGPVSGKRARKVRALAPTPSADKPQQVTLQKFSMTLMVDGTMRVTLDLCELRPETAFGLAEYLRANGLLSKENT
jgi:plasmid maintenance system antidote protein VapI